VHTNTIDGLWWQFKNTLRGMKAPHENTLEHHAAEYMWKHNNLSLQDVDRFEAYLKLCV